MRAQSNTLAASPVIFKSAVLLGLVLLIVTCVGGCANTRVETTDDRTTTVARLAQQADAWDKAIVRKDAAAIAANMTPDFRIISGGGEISNGDTFIRDLTAADLTIDPYTVEDFEVRVYGDTALLSGRTRMTGTDGGKPFVANYRYIDIYVRRDGEWRICSVQITRLPT